jgi:hypothetical protein
MSRFETEEKELNMGGYDVPIPGIYTAIVAEGIKMYSNEKTGNQSMIIPFELESVVVPGDEESIGKKVSQFIPCGPKETSIAFGEKQLAHILSYTKLASAFDAKYPDTPISAPDFIAGLNKKLVGKMLIVKLEEKDKRVNIVSIYHPDNRSKLIADNKGKGKVQSTTPKPSAPAASQPPTDEDGW